MERKKNVAAIKRLFQQKKGAKELFEELNCFLIAKGIKRSIAEKITLDSISGNKISGLKESIVKTIHTAGELSFPKKLALIGPTGVGKTTTILKLATFYQKMGKEVAITTLDEGAFPQLEKHANKLGIKVDASIQNLSSDLILIDTQGCNFYLPERVDQLGEQLASCSEIEILLTLSACAKEVDLYGAIYQFSTLCPKSLAFTKLDETLASGVLINISSKTDFPIRYIAYGYPLPGEIQLADPYKITHKILTDFNQEKFNYLRQLSLCE